MIKTYQMKDVFSAKKAKRFTVDGKSKTIVFESKRKNGLLSAEVEHDAVQQVIEKSKYWKNKTITLVSSRQKPSTDEDEDEEPGLSHPDAKEYPDVTKFREAQDILTAEPYNIPKTSPDLRNKVAILEKAVELGVSFPNLV